MPPETTIYPLPNLRYLHLRLLLTATESAHLPLFKGSMLRGAFGHALKKTVCAMSPDVRCAACMLKQQCAFTRLFETFIQGEPPRFLKGLDTAPRPIIFDPATSATTLTNGDTLPFEIKLMGSAVDFLPYVIFAVLQMAQNGLGAGRHRFELTTGDCLQPDPDQPEQLTWHPLYDAATQSLLFAPRPLPLPLEMSSDFPEQLRLSFTTPTRLKFDGHYSLDFNFRALVFKMLRRHLELAYFYEPAETIDWEFHDLLVAANAVTITESSLEWSDWQRYSNRQQTKMKMGGFVGDLVLEGALAPFQALLKGAEVVHVGKGTVFGLGKVEVGMRNA